MPLSLLKRSGSAPKTDPYDISETLLPTGHPRMVPCAKQIYFWLFYMTVIHPFLEHPERFRRESGMMVDFYMSFCLRTGKGKRGEPGNSGQKIIIFCNGIWVLCAQKVIPSKFDQKMWKKWIFMFPDLKISVIRNRRTFFADYFSSDPLFDTLFNNLRV